MNTPHSQALAEEAMVQRIEQLNRTVTLLQSRIRLLEEENTRFADMLRERGVAVRSRSQTALDLPPPLTQPLAPADAPLATREARERRLLEECAGQDPVLYLVRSATRVDTGEWFRRGVVWVAALSNDLVMVADGKRPWVDRIPFAFLAESLYNHVMGELVLAPSRDVKLSRVRMTPMEGYQMLAQIYSKEEKSCSIT